MTLTLDISADEMDNRLLSIFSGVAIGAGFLVLYLTAGLLFAQWSPTEFFSRLTLETGIWLVGASLSVIEIFAIPVALYRQYRLASPIALLTIVLLVWLVSGAVTGAVFGLSLYVFGFAPVYIILFIALGGSEYYLRN